MSLDFLSDLPWALTSALDQHHLDKTKAQLQDAGDHAAGLQRELRDTQGRLQEANWALLALWELQRERLNLTAEEVKAKIAELKAQTAQPKTRTDCPCMGCGRVIPAARATCMYCGQARVTPGLEGLREPR